MAVKLSKPDKYAKCVCCDKVDWIDESIFVYL